MTKRDLRVFMRDPAKAEETVFAPGPDTLLENGKPVMLEIRVLSGAAIQKINDLYTKRTMATDQKGMPYIQNGEVAWKVERDDRKASGHMLAEALAWPDLKNPELMKHYNCVDISEMASKVFPRTDELNHVSKAVMAALGLERKPDDGKKEIEEAKN